MRCFPHLPGTAASLLIALAWSAASADQRSADSFSVTLRSQVPETKDAVDAAEGGFTTIERAESWHADQTAVIVCDMWDLHHCYRAVVREGQMVPRVESLLKQLRTRGATIIHAPSGCMQAYQDHPARIRARDLPLVAVPAGINEWCRSIPAEEAVRYPIDQSDGGEDDTVEEHQAWRQQLIAKGRDPEAPWKRQHDGLSIDPERDFISDRGDEIWSILDDRDIKNVILLGVHTNMCVLGRPFGLRQLAKNGAHVVLMRDLTDSMYNPARWPFVSHAEGTARIISHIERHVCPTVSSEQFLGGEPFAFSPIENVQPKTLVDGVTPD